VLGDTIANLLDATGHTVTREYYFNDAGRQMRLLGESLRARVEGLLHPDGPTRSVPGPEGDPIYVPDSFPEDGYVGEYLVEIARQLVSSANAADLENAPADFFEHGARDAIFRVIEDSLHRLGVSVDTYFNERSLYEDGRVWDIVSSLRERDLAYDEDGAVWFKTTTFGKDKDTVIVKSSGEPTYRLPDIAYHIDKLKRGFDVVVDIFGADHVDTYPDILNAVDALGFDASKVDVVIYQFVTLVANGEPVKMSTRRATYVTLDELIEEVGEDVTRFFFLMRSPVSHLEFDLNLARQEREKNPVFYLQYAHARICSIVRKASEVGFEFDRDPDLSLLTHPTERELIRTLLEYPDRLERIADAREPHRLIVFLNEVATRFTGFYDACRIIGQPADLGGARMALADATRTVLHNGLSLLGISAPERM
jgi:arginyl-tRNA synthetase